MVEIPAAHIRTVGTSVSCKADRRKSSSHRSLSNYGVERLEWPGKQLLSPADSFSDDLTRGIHPSGGRDFVSVR